jgi:8-oxo-dGTP diphosphatase
VLCSGGKIMLARRSMSRAYYPAVWDVVGGHCLGQESPDDALRREMLEEIGVLPIVIRSLGAFAEPKPEIFGEARHHVFAVTEWHGTPRNLAPEEHDEIGWFMIDELSQIRLAAPEYVEILRPAFAA